MGLGWGNYSKQADLQLAILLGRIIHVKKSLLFTAFDHWQTAVEIMSPL